MAAIWTQTLLPHVTSETTSIDDETPPRRFICSEEIATSQPWTYPPGTPLKASKKTSIREVMSIDSRKPPLHSKQKTVLDALNNLDNGVKKHSSHVDGLAKAKKNTTERYSTSRRYVSSVQRNKNTLYSKKNLNNSGTSRKPLNGGRSWNKFSSCEKSGALLFKSEPNMIKHSYFHRSSKRKADPGVAFIPNPELVVEAVASLYADRIRPFLADILQRVKLLAKQSLINNSETDGSVELLQLNSLDVYSVYLCVQKFCTATLRLIISDNNGCRSVFNPSALLDNKDLNSSSGLSSANRLSTSTLSRLEAELINFHVPALPPVDPKSLNNPYSANVWQSFYAFLIERLRCNATTDTPDRGGLLPYQFKGGRYGLAVELKSTTHHPQLQNLSLGELCHLVQLAITGRLLAYERSVLQPVASCVELSSVLLRLSCPRFLNTSLSLSELSKCQGNDILETGNVEDNGLQEKDNLHLENDETPNQSGASRCFETVEEIVTCLTELFEIKPEGYVIAQLKRVLFSRYGKEILPERFGYRKLTECLRLDPVISSMCHVVSMNSSVHRLLVVPKKVCERKKAGMSPVSPSTMASSCSSTTTGSESLTTTHNTEAVSVNFPECMMNPVNASRCITYYAWKLYSYDSLYPEKV